MSEIQIQHNSLASVASRSVLNSEVQSAPSSETKNLTVVAAPPATSSFERGEKGVVINGKFFALNLPLDIKTGDRVDVRRTGISGNEKFIFFQRADENHSAIEKPAKEISQILEINRQSLSALRQLLATSASTSQPDERGHQITEVLRQLFVKAGLVRDSGGADQGIIKNLITKPVNQQLLTTLREALSNRESRAGDSDTAALTETLRLIIRQLSSLGIDSLFLSDANSLSQAIELFPEDLSPELAMLLKKLVQVKVGEESSDTQDLIATLKKLVDSQQQLLPSREVQLLLLDHDSSWALEGLTQFLDTLAKSDNDSSQSIKLKAYATQLREQIAAAITIGNVDELRDVLKDGLARLYHQFDLVPLADQGFDKGASPHSIFKGHLRFIEVQLVMLLESPELEDQLSLVNANSEKLLTTINALRSAIKDLVTQHDLNAYPELDQQLGAALLQLDRVIEGEKPSPDFLRQYFQHLRQQISVTIESERLAPIAESKIALISESIAKLLTELAGGQSSSSKLAGQLNPLDRLRELLKNFTNEFSLADGGSRNPILSETFSVLAQLETVPEGETLSPKIKEQLKGALAGYRQLLETYSAPQERESGLHLVDHESLQKATQILAAQDVLQRLTPMAKTFGEPVFMLFPLLLGNILSQAQFSFIPRQNSTPEERKNGAGDDNECFQRLRIDVPLPVLGKVGVDLAYRGGELLLNFTVGSIRAQHIIVHRLPMLRRHFAAAGFVKNQIEVAAMQVEQDSRPLKGVLALEMQFSRKC